MIKHIHHHLKKYRTHFVVIFFLGFISLVTVLVIGNFYFDKFNPPVGIKFGVSFSPEIASNLGLDWKKTYQAILTDLQVKRLRLPSYWSKIQPTSPNQFDYQEVDYLLNEAGKNQAKVILVVGLKQPGWPECRAPRWALDLTLTNRQELLLKYIQTTVKRYQSNSTIWAWQVENEPLFKFGNDCDEPNRGFLAKEVALVKSIDPTRPIIITDSGELRPWRTPMQLSDIFGTTLYRSIYDKFLGYFYWPIPPAFYHFKSDGARVFFAHNNQRTIISELQTEPWSQIPLVDTTLDKQIQVMDLSQFKDNLEYGKKTGFDEIYLWGVEWWYFMKEKGHPEYLNYTRTLFR